MTDIVAKQHLLPSSVWLARELRKQEKVSQITFTGKCYSTIPSVLRELEEIVSVASSEAACFQPPPKGNLIMLDEGGGFYAALPAELSSRTAVVEQTTFGLKNRWQCPTVLVCRSAAKLVFESQIISRGVVRKLMSLQVLEGRRIGIIGLGALGAALARSLLQRGYVVHGCEIGDPPHDLLPISRELDEVLRRSDIIMGCTGSDALRGANLAALKGERIFVSCSSQRAEFPALVGPRSPCSFKTVSGSIGTLRWHLLNAGYPINFDRVTEWEKFDEIVLTRRLMLEGVRQADLLIGGRPIGAMLDPVRQYEVILEWLDGVPDVDELHLPSELSVQFLRDNSEGEYAMTEQPSYHLHSTTPDALAQMRSHLEPYDVTIMGLPIRVRPGVWSPAYDWSSLFYLENLNNVAGKSFLEIGSGTGVISVFVAKAGARLVVATDINPLAVENTRINFERFDLHTATAIQSDCFSAVRDRFDIVLWNAPYHGCRAADDLERGCSDENYTSIRSFFRDVGQHLNPRGKVIFGFSESGDLSLIRNLIAEAGFRVKRQLSDWRQDYNCMLFELVEARRS